VVAVESARLQKTHLPGFLGVVPGQFAPELFLADTASHFTPILARVFESPVDDTGRDSTLAQLRANPDRSFTLADTRCHERLDITLVALQIVLDKRGNGVVSNISVKAKTCQLVDQFRAAVFAARNIVLCLLARFDRV
jgi:hypothetical protein